MRDPASMKALKILSSSTTAAESDALCCGWVCVVGGEDVDDDLSRRMPRECFVRPGKGRGSRRKVDEEDMLRRPRTVGCQMGSRAPRHEMREKDTIPRTHLDLVLGNCGVGYCHCPSNARC
jgi:hypothetical protein